MIRKVVILLLACSPLVKGDVLDDSIGTVILDPPHLAEPSLAQDVDLGDGGRWDDPG